MTATDLAASWKRQNPASASETTQAYVAAGSFASEAEARAVLRALSSQGRTVLEKSETDGASWYTVNVYPDGRRDIDGLLETAWANGAPDAITVRD
jgi:rare lipoprotein A